MVEHTINFTDEGAVNIDIDYRAYIESALKGSKLDALSNSEILARREEREEKLSQFYQNGCTQEEISKLKKLFSAEEEEELKAVYRRLLSDLENKEKIYSVVVEDDGGYRKNGFFEKSPVINKKPKTVDDADSELPSEEDKEKESDSIPTKFVTADPDNTIQFFYLGDLFYLSLDSLFWEQQNKVKNTRFIRRDTTHAASTRSTPQQVEVCGDSRRGSELVRGACDVTCGSVVERIVRRRESGRPR